jgi:hypothetical protein
MRVTYNWKELSGMIRRIARMAGSGMALLAAVVLVAAGGLALVPAASASARVTDSSIVEAWFGDGGTGLQPCSAPGTQYYNSSVTEIYNPCSYRVWVHYVSGSTVESYCVNPGGGLAYKLPITWAGGDSSDIQLTTNTSLCAPNLFGLNWCATDDTAPCPNALPTDPPPTCGVLCPYGSHLITSDGKIRPDGVVIGGYYCTPGGGPDYITNEYIFQLWNAGCNFRIWIHGTESGGGRSLCISPGDITAAYSSALYVQVTETNNQVPCSGGNPPYTP